MKRFPIVVFLFSYLSSTVFAQDTTEAINHKRLRTFTIASTATYTLSMAGLYHLWYRNSEQQPFQFFNDNGEWKQVDKVGHFYSAFYISYATHSALRWSNVPAKKAQLAGAITGFAVLLPIEIFDGFSRAYGASTGDLIANAGGSLLFLGQYALWNEPRIFPKFSFHRTAFAPQRPNTLGGSFLEEVLKDYNGQTYWLSIDLDKFTKFPKWLNVAVGYGAEEMIFGRDWQNRNLGFNPYRQYYLSLDLDLTGIRTRSKSVRTMLQILSIIKLPAPALSFSRKGGRFDTFYY